MRVRVLLPHEVLVDTEAHCVVAEADDGHFALLPRHADFAATLPPGILRIAGSDGELLVAVDDGVLVKCGDRVDVAAIDGARGEALETLAELVRERFLRRDEHERQARTALARLEAGTLRRFRQLGDTPGA